MRKQVMNQINQYIDELKTIRSYKLDGPSRFLSVETYKCELNNDHTITREKILKGKKDGGAAIIFAMTEDKEFLLSVEPRVFTERTVGIGLPAGYIEEGEEPSDAAKRELLEETGYEADKLKSLGSFYQDQGCSKAFNHYFLATGCKKVKEQNLDKDEFVKYVLVNYDELKWLLENGYIEGLNSAYAILKGKEYIK